MIFGGTICKSFSIESIIDWKDISIEGMRKIYESDDSIRFRKKKKKKEKRFE